MYFTQLLGLALGIGPRRLGIHTNISDASDLIVDKRLT
jgi:heterodisulfide reductase subunit B